MSDGRDEISSRKLLRSAGRVIYFFNRWTTGIKEAGEAMGWWDRAGDKGMWKSMAVAGILMLLVAPYAVLFGPWAIVIGAAAIVVFILSFTIRHRTFEGELEARRWKAFKRYLSGRDLTVSEAMVRSFDACIVYGLALGVPQPFLKKLFGAVPSEELYVYLPWFLPAAHGTALTPDAFERAFNSMVSSMSTTLSSASGRGGGASGGGGGGHSSGGGGAG